MINTLNWLNNRELRAKEFAISREISLFHFFRLQAVPLVGMVAGCFVVRFFGLVQRAVIISQIAKAEQRKQL